jgi:hypothetical protein
VYHQCLDSTKDGQSISYCIVLVYPSGVTVLNKVMAASTGVATVYAWRDGEGTVYRC